MKETTKAKPQKRRVINDSDDDEAEATEQAARQADLDFLNDESEDTEEEEKKEAPKHKSPVRLLKEMQQMPSSTQKAKKKSVVKKEAPAKEPAEGKKLKEAKPKDQAPPEAKGGVVVVIGNLSVRFHLAAAPVEPPKPADPAPVAAPVKRRKKASKQVRKTYVDDSGNLGLPFSIDASSFYQRSAVTEMVNEEYEITDDEAPPQVAPQNLTSGPQKTAEAPATIKAKPKQASIMGFFAKKPAS